MGYLIKNGTVVYANGSYTADVLVEGEKITQVAKTIDAPGMTVIDASGKYIFPGFIDTIHTFRSGCEEIFIPQMIFIQEQKLR